LFYDYHALLATRANAYLDSVFEGPPSGQRGKPRAVPRQAGEPRTAGAREAAVAHARVAQRDATIGEDSGALVAHA